MHNSQRVLSQFVGRTLLKKQQHQPFPINIQQQQQQQSLLTLACCSSSTISSSSSWTEPINNNNTKNSSRPSLLSSSSSSSSPSSPLLMSNPAQYYSKFTAARETSLPLGSHPLCEERALDLISNLKETELAAIKLALKKYEAKKQKEGFEGKSTNFRK